MTADEWHAVILADAGIWSDEVEQLAKLRAVMLMQILRKFVDWRKCLPDRFLESSLVTSVPAPSEMKVITRGLSKMLDGLLQQVRERDGLVDRRPNNDGKAGV